MCRSIVSIAIGLLLSVSARAQVTTGVILGVVHDATGATVADASIRVRSLETNAAADAQTDLEGRFRFVALPVGSYELTVEKTGFAGYRQGPIVLRLNQEAELTIKLEVAGVSESVTVDADAPLINSTNAEVGVNFDTKRISELPLAPNRNVLNLALSAAGVNPLHDGQRITGVSTANAISVNGMRARSNNIMIDGQDSNNALQTTLTQSINNPDIVAEFRLLTNQFAPEYGRAAGSVVNLITKSGSNEFHGSAFEFHNDNQLNSRTNLDKLLISSSPFRAENQFGGTVGGPVIKDKTFFFGSLQRWTDRRFAGGTSFQGAPTVEGRTLLQSLAGDRPTVKILLENLPAAQTPVAGLTRPLRAGGRTVDIPLGTLTGTSRIVFNDWQWSGRVDHRFNVKHTLGGRYLFDDRFSSGDGQITPPGLSTVQKTRPQAVSAFLNSAHSPRIFHELRLSYQRGASNNVGANPAAVLIPSIEVPELGLSGSQSAPTRTAIGLGANLPTISVSNNYQVQDTWSFLRGPHSIKFGLDFRRQDLKRFFPLNNRGQLVYISLQDLVDDVAQSASINTPLAGGEQIQHFRYYDYYFFLQDQWRIHPRLAITYGIRYESPGNAFDNLRDLNRQIVAAAGGDLRFSAGPLPQRDNNNWAPRLGFNYRVAHGPGILGRITGDGKLVARGGYSRTYDVVFLNLASTVATAFPFFRATALPARTPNSLETLRRVAAAPLEGDPNLQSRQQVAPDLRLPVAEQFSLELQRELKNDWALSIGYVGTKGTALFEPVDGNPVIPGTGGRRLDPSRGRITVRCNCGSSIFHSLQTSLEKRLSRNFSIAAHYTWSTFIDEASDAFTGTSQNGDIGFAQDPFNRRADRSRSAFDRPHRFVANGVFELPFMRTQDGVAGKILGGWQLSGFLTFQSGAPFAALDGADPGNRLGGLASTVRANVNTDLDLARMSVEQILEAGGARLFSRVTAANPLGNLGRNVLRSDGIGNLDLGLFKNTRFRESQTLQFRAEFYNATNTRNFGIPEGRVNSPNFLNQWGTDGGNRRIVLALRYMF